MSSPYTIFGLSIRHPSHQTSRPADEVWKSACRVGHDHTTRRISETRSLSEHVVSRSGGLVRIIDDWLRRFGIYRVGIDGMCRVDEDHACPTVQLLPSRLDIVVSKESVLLAVASEKGHSIGFQDIQSVLYLVKGGLRIKNIRETGEETKFLWLSIANPSALQI